MTNLPTKFCQSFVHFSEKKITHTKQVSICHTEQLPSGLTVTKFLHPEKKKAVRTCLACNKLTQVKNTKKRPKKVPPIKYLDTVNRKLLCFASEEKFTVKNRREKCGMWKNGQSLKKEKNEPLPGVIPGKPVAHTQGQNCCCSSRLGSYFY